MPRAEEWEKITGAAEASMASCIVFGATWGEIDQHAEAIHLADHGLAERRQAVVGRIGRRGIGPVVVLGVGEGHVARAGVVELTQHGHRVVDRMPPFDADQRRDLPGLVNADHIVRGERQRQRVGIERIEPMHDVDLFERRLHGIGPFHRGGHVDRPELAAHVTLTQSGDVGVQRILELRLILSDVDFGELVFDPLAVLPGEVVVTRR